MAFAGFQFPPEVILLAVRWYLRFGLSYRVSVPETRPWRFTWVNAGRGSWAAVLALGRAG